MSFLSANKNFFIVSLMFALLLGIAFVAKTKENKIKGENTDTVQEESQKEDKTENAVLAFFNNLKSPKPSSETSQSPAPSAPVNSDNSAAIGGAETSENQNSPTNGTETSNTSSSPTPVPATSATIAPTPTETPTPTPTPSPSPAPSEVPEPGLTIDESLGFRVFPDDILNLSMGKYSKIENAFTVYYEGADSFEASFWLWHGGFVFSPGTSALTPGQNVNVSLQTFNAPVGITNGTATFKNPVTGVSKVIPIHLTIY